MAFDAVTYAAAKGSAKTYTDTRIDTLIPGLTYKGSVATVADLPATGNQKGDAYNVTDGSGVYAWDGGAWGSASKEGPQGETGATGPQGPLGIQGPTGQQGETGPQGPQGQPGSQTSVSATGTSTNDVRYITIDGTESRFSAVALKAMKSAWVTGSTLNAANAILNDDSVVQGDGFLATVYWNDLPGELTQAEVKAFVMKKSGSYQKIIQFECTSGTVAPYSWFYNSYERVWRSQVPLNNTVTSTATNEALTANMGKNLQDQVNNLKNIGRFLSILDCSNGTVSTQPAGEVGSSYSFKVGDYYRVGADGTYGPKALDTYTIDATSGSTNFESGATSYSVGDVIYCSNIDSTNHTSTWAKQTASGGGTVQDVQINGTSIVALGTGIANIPYASVNESGVIKVGASFNTVLLSSGYMQAVTNTYAQYQSRGNDAFIGKGTLENVLNNESVRVDKATSLTDAQKAQARTNIGAITMAEYDSTAASYEENILYYVVED